MEFLARFVPKSRILRFRFRFNAIVFFNKDTHCISFDQSIFKHRIFNTEHSGRLDCPAVYVRLEKLSISMD